MWCFKLSSLRVNNIGRPLSRVRLIKRTVVIESSPKVSLASSARDVFSFSRLSNVASKSLDIYARIAFREATQHKETQEPSHEGWDELIRNENDYIYRYVHKRLHERFQDVGIGAQNLPVYSQIQKLDEICAEMKSSGKNAKSHITEITRVFSSIKESMEIMNQLELASLLTAIKDRSGQEFRSVKRMIDFELRWLLKKNVRTRLMDLDLWLYLADIFYESKMRSTFSHVLLNYLTAEPEVSMSNRQLIHMLFLVILKRQQDGLLEKYEDRIVSLLSRAPIEEISVICMAYFKTKTPIKNHALLRRIVNQTTERLSTVDPSQPGYGSIIKSVRYSRHSDIRENVLCLVGALLEENNKQIIFASPYNAVQTIKLMEAYRIYNPRLLDTYWRYIFDDIDNCRAKDVQYALTSLSNFSYKDLALSASKIRELDILVDRLVSQSFNERSTYQLHHIVPFARALAVFGYYNERLTRYISECLNDPERHATSSKVIEFEKSVLIFYTANSIEGNRASLKIKSDALYNIVDSIDRTIGEVGSLRANSLNRLSSILEPAGFKKKYQYYSKFKDLAYQLASREEFKHPDYRFDFQHTMPHQNYVDLVVSYKSPNPGCFDTRTLIPKQARRENHVIIYGLNKTDFIDGFNLLSGYKKFMIRLLSKLGYKVITINFDDMNINSLVRSLEEHFQATT